MRDMTAKPLLQEIKGKLGADLFSTSNPEELPGSKEELEIHMQLNYKQSVEIAEEEVIGVIEEVVVTEAAHEACKYVLNLSESNIALFKSELADGTLFNVGPQVSSGTEFTANRWDAYANCVSNYVNPF